MSDEVLSEPVRHLPWLEGQPFSAGAFFAYFTRNMSQICVPGWYRKSVPYRTHKRLFCSLLFTRLKGNA
jgi:hypothetical protein